MDLPRKLALALAALGCLATAARATETFSFPEGAVRRDFMRLPSELTAEDGVYEAMMVRPNRDGRFPLAIISHGTPRELGKMKDSRAAGWTDRAIEFARQGYAALAFLRRGYGTSLGGLRDNTGPCRSPDYFGAGSASAQQIADVVAAIKNEPYIDPTRIVAVGQSAGGLASLAYAAREPEGLVAVLNFAGGRGSAKPDENCNERRLIDAMGRFGATARVPTLWVYSENDHFFGPKLAHAMHEAWTRAGGQAEFIAAPSFREDGHYLFSGGGLSIWRGYASTFLRKLGLPAWQSPPDDAPARIAKPSGLGTNGSVAFEEYRRSTNFHKAFAMNNNGRFAWQTGFVTRDEAAEATLKLCNEHGACRVVLIDNAVPEAR
jgi:dienelactone hydrolase